MVERVAKQNESQRRGAVAVIVRGSRLLVIRRSKSVVAPGMYCFPGGGIEEHETAEAAVVRELQEELAVEVRPTRLLWESVTPWKVQLSWWLSELAASAVPTPNPTEVESIHWLTPEEMLVLPELLESNRHFLMAMEQGRIDLAIGGSDHCGG